MTEIIPQIIPGPGQQQTAPPPIPPSITETPDNKANILLIILIIVPILLLILIGTGAVLVAYEKVSIGDKTIQQNVSNLVMALPFMPKTPKYILNKSLEAQIGVDRFTFDLSIAATSPSFTSLFGSSNLDFSAKGPVDYTDLKNPAVTLDLKSKDIDINYILKDEFHYFKVNHIPAVFDVILAEMGFGSASDLEKVFLNKWFYIDGKPLDTEARRELEKNKQTSQYPANDYIDKLFTTLNQKEFSSMIQLNKEKMDSFSTYKIHFEPSDALLDKLYVELSKNSSGVSNPYLANAKISNIITKLKMDSWIDDKDFYLRKMLISYEIKTNSPPTTTGANVDTAYMGAPYAPLSPFASSGPIPVTFSLVLSDYGKVIAINKPEQATNIDDLFKTLSEQVASQSAVLDQRQAIDSQFSQANNTNRRSAATQILNAVGAYQTQKKALPPGISTVPKHIATSGANLCTYLVPTYIPALPVDPMMQNPGIKNCTLTYDTQYTIFADKNGRITVSAPLAEKGEIISVSR